jgi:hypothetical protein
MVLAFTNEANPDKTSILFFFIKNFTPCALAVTTFALRCTMV